MFSVVSVICLSTGWSHVIPNRPVQTSSLGGTSPPPPQALPTRIGAYSNLFTCTPAPGMFKIVHLAVRAVGLRLKGLLARLNFDCTWNVRRLSRSHIMYERKTESDPSALNTEQYELRRVRTSADTARSASSAEWCKSTIVRNPS